MKIEDENQLVKINITYKTLKKILESNLLTGEEYANLIMNGVHISKYNIYGENLKLKNKMEKQYEKTKNQILHKQEVRKKHLEKRKLNPPKRKIRRED